MLARVREKIVRKVDGKRGMMKSYNGRYSYVKGMIKIFMKSKYPKISMDLEEK